MLLLFHQAAVALLSAILLVAASPTNAFLAAAPRPIRRSQQHIILMAAAAPPPPPPPVVTVASSAASSAAAPSTTASNLPPQKELLAKSAPSSPAASSSAPTSTAAAAASTKSNNKEGAGIIIISSINYDGQVPKTESDEYVVITNNSKSPVDISGYYVYVATTGTQGPTFTFPKATKSNNPTVLLKGGESVKIYTNEIHKESGSAPSSPAASSSAPTSTAAAAASTKSNNKEGAGIIIISSINYDGQVPKTESDEYVVITNNSKSPVDISGYYVYVATTGTQGPTFTFPKATKSNNPTVLLKGGESVKIYTNEIHKESGGYSFGSGKAIWSNKGGLAVLKDGAGKKIGEFKY